MHSAISGQTRIVGIFGAPIAHTRSPAMQNAAFQSCGLPYVYVPFLVQPAKLSQAVAGIRALNLAGVNVTVPHKERVLRYLDSVSPEAKLCGAVNTIVNRQGHLCGENTDGRGFLLSLREQGFSPRGKEIIVLGAGGSARAVLVSLIRANCRKILIVNRTRANAQLLVRTYRSLGRTALQALPLEALQDTSLLQHTDLIVNCTSIGLHNDQFFSIAYAATPEFCIFYDLLYHSRLTAFLRPAKKIHRRTIDGRHMLLHQGALAFTLWTQVPAPLPIMERALNRALRRSV